MRRLSAAVPLLAFLLPWTPLINAQSLQPPASVRANTAVSVPTTGQGDADLYLVGPSSFSKRKIKLGVPIQIAPEELHSAGQWLMTIKSGQGTETATFEVLPAETGHISFVVRPSRLPVAVAEAISGTAYLLDNYHNLVTATQDVTFRLSIEHGPTESHVVRSKDGVAWIKLDSGPRQGAAEFVASVGDVSENRIVQEVASHGCNLRITARPASDGLITVATDPVRDCSGNPIPDGTIVTFTQTQHGLVTTVDAPIKKGIAQVELAAVPGSVISAASGVIMGNELHWGRP